MDQLFAVRYLCENYLANVKDVFWALTDLEKAHNMIDHCGMYQILRVFGVIGKLLKAVQSHNVDSRKCVSVRMDLSEWFQVNVGLTQCCVMFASYMDCVVRELNAGVLVKGWKPLGVNGGSFEKKQLLFADDTALVGNSEEKLCRLVSEFGTVCHRRKS